MRDNSRNRAALLAPWDLNVYLPWRVTAGAERAGRAACDGDEEDAAGECLRLGQVAQIQRWAQPTATT